MGDNPIWHNDVLGDRFRKKDQEKVDKVKETAESRIKAIDKEIEKVVASFDNAKTGENVKGLNDQLQDLNNQKVDLKASLNEIKELEGSPQLFKIKSGNIDGGAGETTYNWLTKAVTIKIGPDALDPVSTLGHELKHGVQFLHKQLTFTGIFKTNRKSSIENEIEAYKRQYALNPKDTKTGFLIHAKTVITFMEQIVPNVVKKTDPLNYGDLKKR